MKTTPEHQVDEATKRLFRGLFEFQYGLENSTYNSDPEVQMIISAIDDLFAMKIGFDDDRMSD